jgi:ubiquinone/menaquinone biosynthesis C-methylase UbiE
MNIAKHIGATKIIGIDLDDKKVEKARRNGMVTAKADLNGKWPLDDDSVDVVFANQVIEHIVDIDNFVGEIFRVLRRGGYVLICTENLASWHNIFALLLGDQPYSGPHVSIRYSIGHHPLHPQADDGIYSNIAITKHNTVMAYKALKKILRVYGFRVEKITGSGYYPFPRPIARFLCRLDPAHSHFLTVKSRKPRNID